jgi:DNA-directed RNA polymerase specialized sigma24 family protein
MTENECNRCVNLYADNVYRFILKNLRHEADAKDIVQGSFEDMWINRAKLDNARSKKPVWGGIFRKIKRVLEAKCQYTKR